MGTFEKFKQKHGPPSQCAQVPAAGVERYRGKLPDDLLRDWEETGWCAYGEGLLWTVNPDDYSTILSEWLEDASNAYAFVRTGLGSIIYWDGRHAQFLDVIFGNVSLLFHTMELNFDGVLCDDQYLDAVIKRQIFQEALPRLGPPGPEECYGFHPAVALGGPGTADTLRRVKLREHLALLAQIAGG